MDGKLYCIYDKVGECPRRFGMYPNDVSAIRDLTIIALGELRIPLCDLEVRRINLEYSGVVDWKLYKFPESNADALAPLGASPEAIKQAFEQKTSDIK